MKSKFALAALNLAQYLLVSPQLAYGAATSYGGGSSSSSSPPDCKCVPGNSCWPSAAEWNQFNKTLNGALIKTVPPAAVCYAGSLYNEKACNVVNQNFNTSFFHVEDPSSVFYPSLEGNSCLPTSDPKQGKCTVGNFPQYVVNASTTAHVQAGVAFAKKHNIRLVVKGTGHDFLGKSIGFGSLSIWTRHMKKLKFEDSFTPKGCKSKGEKAATIGAGEVMVEVYNAANKNNVTVVGGADLSVGIGGFLTGGGHSPISSHYGLACQQALEYEVVTADGKVVTANKCQNSDLYYALSGAGGSTFGLMTAVTVKTFDVPTITFATFNISITTDDEDAFWEEVVAFSHTLIPQLVDAGLMGYYFVLDTQGLRGMMFLVHVVNKPASYLTKILKPLSDKFSKAPYFITPIQPFTFPTFFSYWNTTLISSESVAGSSLLPSRLLPKSAFTDRKLLAQKLKESTDASATSGFRLMLGHLVAGPGVRNHPNTDIGMNPAWREAYVHLISPLSYPNEEPGRTAAFNLASNTSEYALRQLAPDAGAYLNEAIPTENNFQWSFFGSNYPRLLSIKQKYDPDNVFWAKTAVGSEVYTEGKDGALCKTWKN